MSLYSYSTISSCKPPSESSVTTVSSQWDNERGNLTTDDEQWPAPPVEASLMQDHWRIEKNISLKDPQWQTTDCILQATMTKDRILLHDPSSSRSTILPGKHLSMKVVFHL